MDGNQSAKAGDGRLTIKAAMNGVTYPVCHAPYHGTAKTYLTYQFIAQTGQIYAEGGEVETGVMFALDYYTSTAPLSTAIKAIKAKLKAGGYNAWVEQSVYEEDAKVYHVALTAVAAGEEYD